MILKNLNIIIKSEILDHQHYTDRISVFIRNEFIDSFHR